jgi:hypothetical protein
LAAIALRVDSAPVRFGRIWILASALVLCLGLAACGKKSHPTTAESENNGAYLYVGPVTFQLQVSRELNPYSAEDSQYLSGLPTGTKAPTPSQLWYGVFLWAKNQSNRDASTNDSFVIEDTQGNKYYPIALNPSVNRYAWMSEMLRPSATQPGPDTAASWAPTQGALLLFKLNTSVYSNRPLTLYIYAAGESKPSTISLDL